MPVYTLSDSSSGSHTAANGETLTAVQTAQDNPVGIIKKSIYIIRNVINNKVYVGQSSDPKKRFMQHIQEARCRKDNSALHSAIRKYGAENFFCMILESNIENYNERERFWISFYDSISPNGYNIAPGGEDPPIRRGFANNKSKFTREDISQIYEMLRNNFLSIKDIADRFGVSEHTIAHINSGLRYRDDNVSYPIRAWKCSGEAENMLSYEQVVSIANDIVSTDCSLRSISRKYNVSPKAVEAVNRGEVQRYRIDGLEYPLRVSTLFPTEENVKTIKRMLISGNMSNKDIARKTGVSYAVIRGINSGDHYRDESLTYPLKRRELAYGYDESVYEGIRFDLSTEMSVEEIVSKYSLPNESMVYDINAGKSHRSEKYTYPIRSPKDKFSPDVVMSVTKDVSETAMTLSDIARKHGVHKGFVLNIKNGSVVKYRLPGYTYPLR